MKGSFLFFLCLAIVMSLFSCNSKQNSNLHKSNGNHEFTNKLIEESSPYLLQHAHNPVDWYPWGEEALKKAEEEDKLLIISVGYAACHWCHVMEHESFEDTAVARIMNKHFVSIKVDREERPDVDQIYMDAAYLVNKRGGWPLNAIALPDGKPIFAGTYFKKDQWLEVLEYFNDANKNNKEAILEQADNITKGIQEIEIVPLNKEKLEFQLSELDDLFGIWKSKIDYKEGGRGEAPKFPMPNNYEYLLRYHFLSQDEKALEAVTVTLDKMAFGGIYDHLGGGFARYSTDAVWLVPHFEKMLYDNAQLIGLYSEAFQLTKKPLYKKVVEETFDFMNRELSDKNGGYYSSLDADSEGVEGKFYVFTKAEIDSLLGEKAKLFNEYYNITEKGNWEEHKNILHRKKTDEQFIKKNDLNQVELNQLIAEGKEKLFAHRAKRIRPGLDNKLLTSWNALTLKGLVTAYRVFQDDKYLKRANKLANYISENCLKSDYRLNRNYMNGKSSINAFLDDYALTIEAFVHLYQATFEEEWLMKAKGMADYAIKHFFDSNSGMFFYTSDEDAALIARKMEVTDNVIPGSNSSMAMSLYLLGTYFYDQDYLDKSRQMLTNVKGNVQANAPFYSNWAKLMTYFISEPYEVAIMGENFENYRRKLDEQFLPNMLVLGGKVEGNLELLKNKLAENKTLVYVCQKKVCKFPVEDPVKAIELMK